MAKDYVKVTKTIKFIESMMEDPVGEPILFSVYGVNEGTLGELVMTEKRLIFGKKSFFSGESFEDVYYKEMHSFDYKENFKEATLEIYMKNSNRIFKFSTANEVGLRLVRDYLRERLSEIKKEVLEEKIGDSEDLNVVDQLQKLVELKEQGHISEDEFTKLKMKLLD
ncbi:PH domain-containing protein [Bacillus spongiae]|uniref:PH domain-containing protein n=1 Tax=Bacillus spongiae TaxID=2683610 RepID=A0ABU8HD19_9BACI